MKFFLATSLIFGLLFSGSGAQATSTGISYHGRLLLPTGEAVKSLTQFRIQIRTPGTENCLMYEETTSRDLSLTDGVFSITIADGTGTRTDLLNWSLDKIFANRSKFTFTANCSVGLEYTPSLADGRRLQVAFNDGSFAGWEELPVQNIGFAPISIESVQVGGFQASHLLRVADGAGIPQSVAALTPAYFTELVALAAGTSTVYAKAGAAVSGDAITAGTIGGATIIDTTGTMKAAAMSATTGNFNTLDIWKADNSNKVSLKASASQSANYILTLPVNAGTAGQVLSTDGAGILSWTAAGGTLGAASGDVSGTYPALTVTQMQGRAIASTAPLTGQVLAYGGASWAPKNFGIGDLKTAAGASQFSQAACTAAQTLTWSSLTDVFTCADITGLKSTSLAAGGTTGQVLKINVSGDLEWGTDATGGGGGTPGGADKQIQINNAGAFSGDAELTYPAPGTIFLGPAPSAYSTGGQLYINDGSSARSEVHLRNTTTGNASNDGSSIAQVFGDMVIDNYESGYISFLTTNTERMRILAGGNVGIGTLTPSEKLEVNGRVKASEFCIGASCIAAWPSGGSSQWVDGGSSKIYYSAGNVGIGTATPAKILDVAGDVNINGMTLGLGAGTLPATSLALGTGVLGANTTGLNNIGIGYQVLYTNTGGGNNTGLGTYALNKNSTGNNNTSVGYQALYQNTTGSNNTAQGAFSLNANTAGNNNTGLGYGTLQANTSGTNNTATGGFALNSNVSGHNNAAYGYFALNKNTSGQNNTAHGFYALQANTTGLGNVALGDSALYSNVLSSGNTAVGTHALYDFAGAAAYSNNTVIGYQTGGGITTGTKNTIIGANVTGLAAGLSNTVILADGDGNQRVFVDSTGKVGIGNSAPTEKLEVTGKIKATELCIGTDCKAAWPAGGSGTVTGVTSANAYLTVANGTTTPALTLNVGAVANTVAAGDDARFTDSRAPNGNAGGDLTGTYPNPTIAKIRGNGVTLGTIPGADIGKVYRWDGTNLTAAFLNFGDLRTAAGAQQLTAACAASEKIQWSVITDAFTCQAIGSLDASAITAGTINSARLPASATFWQDGGSSRVYYSAGNVGIGTATPASLLEVNGTLNAGASTFTSVTSGTGTFGVVSVTGALVSGTNDWAPMINIRNQSATGYSGAYLMDTTGANRGLVGYANSGAVLGGNVLIGSVDGTTPLVFAVDSQEAARISPSNGFFGIGTNNPTTPLYVKTTAATAVASFQNATGTCTITPNTSSLSCSSDIRLKRNIENILGLTALNKILQLQAKSYEWKGGDDSRHIGYIAQEAEKIVPELVTEDSKGFKQISYSGFVPLLSEAIKEVHQETEQQKRDLASIQQEKAELSKKVEELTRQNELLEQQNKAFEARLKKLENQLSK